MFGTDVHPTGTAAASDALSNNGIAIFVTIILPGFHWAAVRGQVIPADRWRFWVGIAAMLVVLPTLLYLPHTELRSWTGILLVFVNNKFINF